MSTVREQAITTDVRERLRAKVEALRDQAKHERDATPEALMRDYPYLYGQRMWYGGVRVTGIVEALALLDGES